MATKARKRKAAASADTPQVGCETDATASDEGEEEGDRGDSSGIETNFRPSRDSSTIAEGDWMVVDVNGEVAMDKQGGLPWMGTTRRLWLSRQRSH
ncbi:hypothetical protein NW754_003588 [Fusarium falciforme]|nr:hypothetical protein NW754_003588 [Fusarium falciforme]